MKQTRRLVAITGLIAILLCLLNIPSLAQGSTEAGRFPEGVVEVP